MSEVKRIDIDHKGLPFTDNNGVYVFYEDYAALEVKCAALAAENAGLKSGAMDEINVINRGGQVYCVKDGVQVNPMYARGWNDYRAKSLQSDTPATDAFLAEVREHDLNAFIRHHSAELDAHIKNGGEQFDEKSVRIRDIIVSARLFREQIRKGAAL